MPRTAGRLATASIVATLAGAGGVKAQLPEGSPTEVAAAIPTMLTSPLSSNAGGVSPDEPGTPDLRVCAVQEPKQRPVRQATSARRRQSRMFGWLWRSTRDIDIERTGAPLLFYLRSPLLTALPERSECAHEMVQPEPDEPASCASLAVNAGSHDAYSVAIALPQLAAGSPASLGDAVRGRLGRGSPVTLRALGGAEIEFSPHRVRQIEARACTADV